MTVNAARRVFHGFCSSSRQRGHRRPLTPRLQFNLEQLNATARRTGSGRKLAESAFARRRLSEYAKEPLDFIYQHACRPPYGGLFSIIRHLDS